MLIMSLHHIILPEVLGYKVALIDLYGLHLREHLANKSLKL